MMEHTTDRLFWTLTSVIVGALILTIGVKAFPNVASSALTPMSGFIQQADTQTKNVKKAGDDAIAKETGQNTGSTNSSTQSNTNSQPADPDTQAKANAVEASTLGFTVGNNGDGTGTITGYSSSNTNLNIPKYVKLNGTLLKITSINKHAFKWDGLTSVTIPNSVTSIGDNAFYGNNLTSVNIPNSVTSIGDTAFGYNHLTSVNIPNSVTSIGDDTFQSNHLISVTIPNSVTSIGADAFQSNNLTSVTIPNSVTSINDAAFQSNNLTSVNIPNSRAYQSIQGNQPYWYLAAFDSGVTITNHPS